MSEHNHAGPLQPIWLLILIGIVGVTYSSYVAWDLSTFARGVAASKFRVDAQPVTYFLQQEIARFAEASAEIRALTAESGGPIQKQLDAQVARDQYLGEVIDYVGVAKDLGPDAVWRIMAIAGRDSDIAKRVAGVSFEQLFPGLAEDHISMNPDLEIYEQATASMLNMERALVYTEPYAAEDGTRYVIFHVRDFDDFLANGLSRQDATRYFSVALTSATGSRTSQDPYIMIGDNSALTGEMEGSPYVLSQQFDAFGNRWRIDVTAPADLYPVNYNRVYFALVTSIVLTSLLIYLVWALTDRNRRVTLLVGRRTAALKQLNAELADNYRLLQNLNQELDEARQTAESANHAKSGFLATISHELRTPLNAILGFSDMLAKQTLGPIGDARYVEYAGDINKSGMHLLSLINDILDLAKLEAGKTLIDQSSVGIDSLVESVETLLAPEAALKDLHLEFSVDPGLPPFIIGDSLRLRQILINLVGNSIKFTHRGEVVVRFGRGELDTGAPSFEMVVSDTGIGIEPKRIAGLFERFTQADDRHKREQGGVGLGLAICRELVQLMNGKIICFSEIGVGTTFRISLPLIQPEEDERDDDVI